jgi:superfamily II DNA or RNA helicase
MGQDFFKDVGTVIVDEAHLIMSQVLSQSLQYLFPKYVIGLSATPYRPDGMNALMDFYFTEHKIVRNLYRKHTVYKVDTGLTPEVEYDRNGKVVWGKILESQCLNEPRNNLIVDIIQKYPDRIFLVLSKRVDQAQYIYDKLLEKGESVTILIGSETNFDRDARILVGTTGKVGVGFDHPKLDTLLLASDLEEYFIQYLGRVFRREDVEPIVFDLVDNNSILKKHFGTRKGIYNEVGGTIKKYIV